MRATATCLLSSLILTTGALCAAAGHANAAAPASPAEQDAAANIIETGQATWYGPRHEGRRTSSGEVFDSHKLTAAHASLPLGSYVRVIVEDTGRSIVVKVNDREPPHGVRCIDLSHEAAARLGIVGRGVADVKLVSASRQDADEEVAEAPDDAVPVEAARHHAARHGRARFTRTAHRHR